MKLTFSLLLACLPLTALAQADTSFTYQGELKVQGALASGEFDLQACAYSAPSAGSVLACSAIIENLPVADGRFTIALDFGAVFDGSLRYLEMRVRRGNEATPLVPLQPRQLLRATPLAQYASRAPFLGITGVPPSLLDGDDIGVTQIVAGAGLSGGSITSSGTLAIAPGGVAAAMLAPNAIGSAQIDPAQVQARISGTCATGEYFRGFAASGAPQCALLPVTFDRIVDATLDYGRYARLVLRADGRPFLVYHEQGTGTVRIYDCADAVCSNGTARSIASVGDSGEGIALVLRTDGRPLIAYIEATADSLHVYSCNDASCTSGTATTLEAPVIAGVIDMALRTDGRAVLVYRDGVTVLMRTWHCANVDCTSGSPQANPLSPTGVAIAIRPDGRPLLAAGGNGGSADSPRFWDCADAMCTSGTLRPTTGVAFQEVKGMRLRADGRALLLTGVLGGSPSIVACGDVNCSSAPGAPISGCDSPVDSDLALRQDSTAVIACASGTGGAYALMLHDCATNSCSSGSTRQLLAAGRAGRAVAVAIRDDDRPVIAYYDETNGDVGVYVCSTPGCP